MSLYRQCVRWGLSTGAVTGALTGATLVVMSGLGRGFDDQLADALIGAGFGTVIGLLVSVLPAALGGLVVTEVVGRRHPQPSSPDALGRDLSFVFCVVVGVLNVGVVVPLFAAGNGVSSLPNALPLLLVTNACVALMLWRARASIIRRPSKE